MLASHQTTARCRTRVQSAAFSLIELLVSILIFGMMISGLIYGYVQTNRLAEWSAMSYAAQSYALQGLEQVRSAQWDTSSLYGGDDIPVPTVAPYYTNFVQTDIMDVPVTGAPISIINSITLINAPLAATINSSVKLRQVRSDCIWTFPLTGQTFTNTVITFRAPDQQ